MVNGKHRPDHILQSLYQITSKNNKIYVSILITSIKNVAGHDKRPPNEMTPAKIKQHWPQYTTQDDKHTNDKKNPTDKKNIPSIFLSLFFLRRIFNLGITQQQR